VQQLKSFAAKGAQHKIPQFYNNYCKEYFEIRQGTISSLILFLFSLYPFRTFISFPQKHFVTEEQQRKNKPCYVIGYLNVFCTLRTHLNTDVSPVA
jgi:hypothetical protein